MNHEHAHLNSNTLNSLACASGQKVSENVAPNKGLIPQILTCENQIFYLEYRCRACYIDGRSDFMEAALSGWVFCHGCLKQQHQTRTRAQTQSERQCAGSPLGFAEG